MSNDTNAFEYMGSLLARLPFITCFKNAFRGAINEQEAFALHAALQVAVSALIRSRQYYQLDDDAVEACADGFANALTLILEDARCEDIIPKERMRVDGSDWELVFDPGPKTAPLRTDEKGRVWRKVESNFIDLGQDIPF